MATSSNRTRLSFLIFYFISVDAYFISSNDLFFYLVLVNNNKTGGHIKSHLFISLYRFNRKNNSANTVKFMKYENKIQFQL